MGDITFSGGNTAQQALIRSGHAALAVALAAAANAAPSGGASFVRWFGDDAAASLSRVAGVITTLQSLLTTDGFAYDLTVAVDNAAYLSIPVSVTAVAGSQISLVISPSLWTDYDPDDATAEVALGLLQQLCVNCVVSADTDLWGVDDPYLMRLTAQRSPATAQSAPLAYMNYVGEFLSHADVVATRAAASVRPNQI